MLIFPVAAQHFNKYAGNPVFTPTNIIYEQRGIDNAVQDQSAGKIKDRHLVKGNRYLLPMLLQTANAIVRNKQASHLKHFYSRLKT